MGVVSELIYIGPIEEYLLTMRFVCLFVLVGPEGDTYKKCFDEVQKISSATMFSPVTRQEAIQATG